MGTPLSGVIADSRTTEIQVGVPAGFPGFPHSHPFRLEPGEPGVPSWNLRALTTRMSASWSARDRPADSTLNLLGPIVVNRCTRDAAQVAASAGYSTVR
jgi:flagellar assembly factor FliW